VNLITHYLSTVHLSFTVLDCSVLTGTSNLNYLASTDYKINIYE